MDQNTAGRHSDAAAPSSGATPDDAPIPATVPAADAALDAGTVPASDAAAGPLPGAPVVPAPGAPVAHGDPAAPVVPDDPASGAPAAPVPAITPPPAPRPVPSPRPAFALRRSRTDRMLGGVCGGLAAGLGVDAALLRVGLVVLTVFGFGLGAVFYVAAWYLAPEEDAAR